MSMKPKPKSKPRKPSTKAKPRKKLTKRETVDVGKAFGKGVASLIQGLKLVGGAALMCLLVTEEELKAAGGNIADAANGHRCGPNCWHAVGNTEEERQSWWEEKMRRYEEGRAAREAWRARPYWEVKKEDPSAPGAPKS